MTHEDTTTTRQSRTTPTDPTATSTTATDAPRPTRLELSPAQVLGSALAAVSSAFFASWAGTAGTLIGVAAGSVIATVGATTYTWWLRRTQEAVRRRAAVVRQTTLAANGLPRTVSVGPLRRRDGATGATRDQERPDGTDPGPLPGRWALPWKKVLLTSVAVMLLATAAITGFETLTGRTFASYVGKGGSGSTVGTVLGGDSSTRKAPSAPQKSTPTPTPTPTPSSTSTPTATPTEQPTSTGAPIPTPTVPTPSATATQDPGSTPTTSGSGSSTALP